MRRRIRDAIELVTLGVLIAWIVTPLFSSLAARLSYLRGAAIGFLFAAAGLILALARLRRRSLREPAGSTKSSSDATSLLAYAGLGLLGGGLLSGDWMTFGSLAGDRLSAAYPSASILAGIAIVVATLVLLIRRSARRDAETASEDDADPWIERMESVFNAATRETTSCRT